MAIAPATLRLYRRTAYVVGNAPPLRIGRRDAVDAVLDRAGGKVAVLITAANPMSRRRADGWNARVNRGLAEAAHRLGPVPAAARLGAWHEEGFLLAAPRGRAAVLGRRFRQNALVLLRRGQAARLLMLR